MGGFGMGGMTTTTSTSMRRVMPGMMKMGGMGGMMTRRAPPVFKMSGRKATLTHAEQSPKYHPTSYGAEKALENNNAFTHTKNVVGAVWKAKFKGGE